MKGSHQTDTEGRITEEARREILEVKKLIFPLLYGPIKCRPAGKSWVEKKKLLGLAG